MTFGHYDRTSSVNALLTELNWESLADRWKTARLQIFHKIHYQHVAMTMPLRPKMHSAPTRTENAVAYDTLTYITLWLSSVYSFYPKTVRDWNRLPQDTVQISTLEAFKSAFAVCLM